MTSFMITFDVDTSKTLEEISEALSQIEKLKCKIKKGKLIIKKNGFWGARGQINNDGESRIGSIQVYSQSQNKFNDAKIQFKIAFKKLGIKFE